jgi:hypothetical protein
LLLLLPSSSLLPASRRSCSITFSSSRRGGKRGWEGDEWEGSVNEEEDLDRSKAIGNWQRPRLEGVGNAEADPEIFQSTPNATTFNNMATEVEVRKAKSIGASLSAQSVGQEVLGGGWRLEGVEQGFARQEP